MCGSLVVQINRTTHLADLVMFGRTNSSGSRILNHTRSAPDKERERDRWVAWIWGNSSNKDDKIIKIVEIRFPNFSLIMFSFVR